MNALSRLQWLLIYIFVIPCTDPYVSATGKTVVNFLLKQSENLFVKTIRVTIKVQLGSQGAKMGLVFCTDSSKDKTPEALLKEYDQYNGLTADDYNKLKKEGCVYLCVGLCVYLYVCLCVYLFVCLCVFVCVCACGHMCVGGS